MADDLVFPALRAIRLAAAGDALAAGQGMWLAPWPKGCVPHGCFYRNAFLRGALDACGFGVAGFKFGDLDVGGEAEF